jgi:hypothetical protein
MPSGGSCLTAWIVGYVLGKSRADGRRHAPQFSLNEILIDAATPHGVALKFQLILQIPDAGVRVHQRGVSDLFCDEAMPADNRER